MNSLEDLVRNTLAARAHDVDGLALATTPPPRRTARRWAAVGTVVAVAAAILVAVVLVAPWRGAPDRKATPPAIPTPPTSMQWVSYHGITLTVPDSWAVDRFACTRPAASAVIVPEVGFASSCPYRPNQPTTPTDAMVIRLDALGEAPAQGDPITVDGRPAWRFVSDGGPGERAYLQVQLPAAGVSLTIDSADLDDRELLAGITYTPIDANGCTAQLTSDLVSDALPSGMVEAGELTGGSICEYATADAGRYLNGSRRMTDADIAGIQTAFKSATPWTEADRGQGFISLGTLVYRVTRPDGDVQMLAVEGIGEGIGVTDGRHRGVVAFDSNVPSVFDR